MSFYLVLLCLCHFAGPIQGGSLSKRVPERFQKCPVSPSPLQAQIGYSTKSNVSTTIGGATSADLRGTTTYTSATAASNVLYKGTAGGTTAAVSGTTLGGTIGTFSLSSAFENTTGGTTAITT